MSRRRGRKKRIVERVIGRGWDDVEVEIAFRGSAVAVFEHLGRLFAPRASTPTPAEQEGTAAQAAPAACEEQHAPEQRTIESRIVYTCCRRTAGTRHAPDCFSPTSQVVLDKGR